MPDQASVRERVEAALRGDPAAYRALISEFQSGLRGFIAMLGTPPHVVEEIAQETFVLAYKRLRVFEPTRPFGGWLRGIARNLLRQWRDKRGRDGTVAPDCIIDHLMSEEIRNTALKEEEAFRTEHLRDCVNKLPERSRRMLDLKYSARKKSAAIAGELGVDEAVVRLTLCRIRLKLRDCVDKRAAAREAT